MKLTTIQMYHTFTTFNFEDENNQSMAINITHTIDNCGPNVCKTETEWIEKEINSKFELVKNKLSEKELWKIISTLQTSIIQYWRKKQ